MELLDGGTLREIVAVDGPQPPERVIRILCQVADALGEAHDVGLIHRDVKPENIMLTRQGRDPDSAKVLDFGLVREMQPEGEPALTQQDAVQGTPLYMAPETITTANGAEPRSDLYALGAVGYFLLTGEDVFTGKSVVDVCAQHLHSTPTRPSERLGRPVHAELERVILDCLRKDPNDRPSDAAALITRLESCPGVGAWSEALAIEWWNKNGPRVQSLRKTRAVSGSRTLLAADSRAR